MLVVPSATLMLVDLFVAVMKVTVSVAIMQLEVSTTLMSVKISAANMWVTIFIEIMQVQSCRWYFLQCIMHMTISVTIMQVAVSFVAMYMIASNSKFIFLSFKLTRKIKGIISSLHFTTLINILPKLRYFVGRIYAIKRVIQCFCFLDKPIKGGDIMDF